MYIQEWEPWKSRGPQQVRGYQKYVPYVAGQWFHRHPSVRRSGQVKLVDIQDAIDVRDPHNDAIGRNQTILTEISGEIPTDDVWVRHSYNAQSQEVDIFEPM